MSFTPDQQPRKAGAGVSPSPHPFYTPRPERRRKSLDWSSNHSLDRDREVNVQVILRCRPLSDDEQRMNMPRVISCNEQKREVTVFQNLANKQIDRVFNFDKVFGPKSQQRLIYDQAIAPVVNEVLEGFNCTVFAYGQTGTGKTYTMEGGMRSKSGELPVEAGVIPRAVQQIFNTLEAQNADYSMKVTFLELYNEEITDLLAPEDNSRPMEDRQKKPISLLEDGKGCVVVRGLEEETVYSANEIYSLLERGASKRRVAETLLNKHSSRSHSVFTIIVYIKEETVGDEDLIKCGKLNLVDLAGSENIYRSGAREGRAREAGEINKSLLTLGRVINALVEHSGHIPYRDSKLTRLLRDSLGGKTKTCVIATVSPSAYCLEETLSTLDYACRAKNIKNKPEANQKMSKAVLLKDLYLEIERMKEDVRAAREKNGVYISHERFAQDEDEKKAKNEKIEQLELDLALNVKEVEKFRELYLHEQEQRLNLESELDDCKINLEKSCKALQELKESHQAAVSTIKEKESIISRLLQSENSLVKRAKELRYNLENASEDINALFTKIDDKNKLEGKNHGLILNFGTHLDQSLKDLSKTIMDSVSQQKQHLKSLEKHVGSFLASKFDATQSLESRIKKMTETYSSGVGTLRILADTIQRNSACDIEQMKSTVLSQTRAVENFLEIAVTEANSVVSDIQNSINDQKQLLALSSQKQLEGLQRNLVSAQVISKASVSFFNDLQHRASSVMLTIEDSKTDKLQQLETLEMTFKKVAAREEKVAMEKIAAILGALTLKKTSVVSEASNIIRDLDMKESKRLRQEMSNMQQVSADAESELCEYAEKVKSNFLEDTFSSAEAEAALEYDLQECSEKLNNLQQHWENVQLSVSRHNSSNVAVIESTVRENICANNTTNEEFVWKSSLLNAELDARASEIVVAVNDSLRLDRETKKELDSVSILCYGQLESIQEMHGESVSKLQNQAGQCLIKDYLVDQHAIPRKRVIDIPTLVSIENMRAPLSEDLKGDLAAENLKRAPLSEDLKGDLAAENISKLGYTSESKLHQPQQPNPNRTPFTDVNQRRHSVV